MPVFTLSASSTGFVYKLSSTFAVQITEAQSTAILIMITSIINTNGDSSTVVAVNPTNTPSEASVNNSSNIGAIIGGAVGAFVLITGLVVYFVFASKYERRAGKYRNHLTPGEHERVICIGIYILFLGMSA